MKRNIIFGCIFLVGLSIFLYPTVSNWLATRAHYSEVSTYDEKVKELQEKGLDGEEKKRKRKMENYKMRKGQLQIHLVQTAVEIQVLM